MNRPKLQIPNNTNRPAILRAAVLLVLTVGGFLNTTTFAELAIDKLHGYPLIGSAQFAAGGHTASAGDLALDLGTSGGTSLTVSDPNFFSALNTVNVGDKLSVSMWVQLSAISASSAFWFYSPSSNNGQRGYQAHIPWSNDNIYFDTAGCCDGGIQRINADIHSFSGYSPDDTWWNSWHHFVFVKNGSTKQIWIDGLLFLENLNTGTLPTDMNSLAVGSGIPGNASLLGQIDDFAVFGSALSSNDIHLIFTGTAPDTLTADNPLAYWDFNPPKKPILLPIQAGPNSTVTPDIAANLEIVNGTQTSVQVNSIKLAINGTDVTGAANIVPKAVPPPFAGASGATVYYTSPTLFGQASTQMVTLVFSDNGSPASIYSNTWPVIIEPYNGYVTDAKNGYVGFLEGSAAFTPDKGGHRGIAGDRAIDLNGVGSGGDIHVGNAQFLNPGTNQILSFSLWMKMYRISSGATVFGRSPSATGGGRGYAVQPWSDDNIYFDTAGCCDADLNRTVANINTFSGWVDDSFWTKWHNYVFIFNAGSKEIWIDGAQFTTGFNTGVLQDDFRDLFFGLSTADNVYQQAVLDDVAVYASALSPASISALTNNTVPTALAGETVLAYWNCDTLSPGPPFISTASTPGPNSTNALPNVGANILIVNRDTQVQTNTIKVSLNGTDVTPISSFVPTSAGVSILFLSPTLLPALSSNRLTVVFSDNATPANVSSNSWSFKVAPVGAYSQDTLHKYLATFVNNTQFTPVGGGHTGRAIDLMAAGNGGALAVDPPFLAAVNSAAGKDTVSVSFWLKLRNIAQASAFWFRSPTVDRDLQAHTPWDNDNIYFDTAGCCNAPQRINQHINMFPGYTDDSFWTNWHHFAFVKDGTNKVIYIDGQVFLAGTGTAALTTDVTALYIGSAVGGGSLRGWLDDFAVFGGALSSANATALAGGASPSSLGDTNLLAFWDFEDVTAPFIASRTPAPNATGVPAYGPDSHIIATLVAGKTNINSSSIRLTFNGIDVTSNAVITPLSGATRIEYVPAKLPSNSSNRVTLVFSDNGSPATVVSNTWSYVTEAFTGITKDVLHGYEGLLALNAKFTSNGGGHSGQPGDYGMNLPTSNGAIHIPDATFLFPAETNNSMTFSFWTKHYDNGNNSGFWVVSPSSGGGRGFQAHVPYGNTIYFDTAGCCDTALQRISLGIATFQPYIDFGNTTGWWTNWHHWAFVYDGSQGGLKTVWIDGQSFMSATSSSPLPLDFTQMWLGRAPADAVSLHAIMDDFAAFATPLSDTDVMALYQGTLPSALPANDKLLAYWNFNDAPAQATISISRSNGVFSITYTGTLQSSQLANGPYTDVTPATNPYIVDITKANQTFFRSKQ